MHLRRGWGRVVVAALVIIVGIAAGTGSAFAERRRVDPRTGMLEVPIDELVGAIRRKDRAEMGRVAERIGPARLAEALRRPDTGGVLAALAGITVLPGGMRLIGPITELVVTGDPPIAAAAAHALGDVLATTTIAELDDWEVPPDVVNTACVVLRRAATSEIGSTPGRLAALDALADASVICPATPDLIALLHDPTPVIRRAAALVLRPQQRLATGGFASGTRDVDRAVASASVAALCEVLALPGAGIHGGSKEPIWDQTREAARRLAVSTETPPEDAVQMLDCLDPTSTGDRQILDALRARHHTAIGDRAWEILAQAQRRAHP